MNTCSIGTCTGKAAARGWCRKHYARWWRHGDPEHVGNGDHGSAGERLLRFISEPDSNGCANWTGATKGSDRRYGALKVDGTMVKAHRLVYEKFFGPIPDGHDLHHACDNSLCVNPFHCAPLPDGVHMSYTQQMRTP